MNEELERYIDGRQIIASVSGGKDSTAMCLYFKELGIEFTPMFCDTGWESAETYTYLRDYLPGIIGEIKWVTTKVDLPEGLEEIAQQYERRLGHYSAMVRQCLHWSDFPTRLRRWCTRKVKMEPAKKYFDSLDDEPINAVGVRAAESKARSKMPEWEWQDQFDCETWRPLIDWSEQDVIDIHTRHGVMPNQQYLSMNATRVGCYPCIYASKKEIRAIADHSPERFDLLHDLELTITQLAKNKAKQKGKNHNDVFRGWFMNREDKPDLITGKRSGHPTPIRDVIKWAKTKRGGKQYELFMPPSRERGCMRWGLCDTGVNNED